MSGIISDNVGRSTGLIKSASGGVWVKILQQTASTSSSLEWKHGTSST